MKEIKLIRLEMQNFKCFRHLRLDFNGRNASIFGDNACGKTTVFDAMMWVLFSKDSAGNGDKNFEVKPLGSDGNVIDHDALTEVEAVFSVDGEELSLRRTYKEVWTTKRGSSEATYDGNTSEYFVNGVPVKRNGFQDKVNELVDEDTFRLLTSTSYFASQLSWQDRRAALFNVAGVMEDSQILATNEAFAPLVQSMGRLSLEDYKKKLVAEKKKFVGAKTEIPARISECKKTIEDIQGLDFAGAKAKVEALNRKKEALTAQVLAIDHDSAQEAKRMEIREAQLELKALENENNAFRARQETRDVQELTARRNLLQARIIQKKRAQECEISYVNGLEKDIEAARKSWIDQDGEIFSGGVCVTCGQMLPADKVQAAREAFEAYKAKRLDEILQTANSAKARKAGVEARLAASKEEIAQYEAELVQVQEALTAAENSATQIQDMDNYAQRKAAIDSRVTALSKELMDMAGDRLAVKAQLNEQIAVVNREIAEKQAIIGKESLLEYSRQRVEQLRADAQSAAECLEAIEKMLYLMEEYSRYKTRFVEDSINGMFRIARFRLFREQANGGIEDRCDVVHEGVPYISVNNGMKINLGIDIINTLSTAYGVRVPLFIDNAESVTNLEKCGSQIIRLVVSENDKELRISYEN